jgi:hypothetical protein
MEKGLVREQSGPGFRERQAEPSVPLTTDWYKEFRIQDQIDYYQKAVVKNEQAANQLWWIAFFFAGA